MNVLSPQYKVNEGNKEEKERVLEEGEFDELENETFWFRKSTLDWKKEVENWEAHLNLLKLFSRFPHLNPVKKMKVNIKGLEEEREKSAVRKPKGSVNKKVALFHGDITRLNCDVITNAANSLLRQGTGVDGVIHYAAGKELQIETREILKEMGHLRGGETVMTGAYELPCKRLFHTVAPFGENEMILSSCYITCLSLLSTHQFKSIAFPCIGTGAHFYPEIKAAHVALSSVRDWLEENGEQIEQVIFCCYTIESYAIYETIMPLYFPAE